MKFKKILQTTLNEMAMGDIMKAAIVSADNLEKDFSHYYEMELRNRNITSRERMLRQINNDIRTLKSKLDGKNFPTLRDLNEEDVKKILNILKSKQKSFKSPGKKSGVRSSNEDLINSLISDLTQSFDIPVITFDTKGTRIDRRFISELKRDQRLEIIKGQPFLFETKKASPTALKGKNGVLFAEIGKKHTDKTKEEIQKKAEEDPGFKKELETHNKNIEYYYSKDVIETIKKEIEERQDEFKPYLIVGNTNKPEGIKVFRPDEYIIDVSIKDFAGVKRVGLYAKLKPGVSLNSVDTLKSFFEKMIVENTI